MSTMTKVFVVLNSVLSIAVSCLFIAAAAQWSNWRQLAETALVERDAAITHRMNTEAASQAALALKDDAIAAANRSVGDLQSRTQSLTDDLAKTKSDLAQAQNQAMALEAGRTKLQEILGVQTAELQGAQRQNQTLLAQNIDLQTRNSRLNGRVLELSTNVSILTDQARNLQEKLYSAEQQLSRGGISRPSTPSAGAAAPQGAVAAEPPARGEIRGEVVQVDQGYASINVGETSGVVAGMTFMVYRGGTYLGDLIVEKVRPREAGGKLSALVQGEVRVGDPVILGEMN